MQQPDLALACQHLRAADPIMAQIIDGVGALQPLRKRGTLFAHLARVIVGQQVSTAAAASIWRRVQEACGTSMQPASVLQVGIEGLRACGCSERKAGYMTHMAEEIVSGRLNVRRLPHMSDDELNEVLLALPGIGPWTVDMCLMFRFGRPDVFLSW